MVFCALPRASLSCAMFTAALLAFSFGSLQASSINLNIIQSRAGIASDPDQFYDASSTQFGALPRRTQGDAPWTQSEASYQQMIQCPRGADSNSMPRGIVLLVPGTGVSASESYQSSAYYQVLPSLGFNVCLVHIPNYSLGDMQLAAEFVAYAIKYLAPKSTSTAGKINVVSYSQGGPNVQWASTFWPSTQALVQGHVALSPSMKGTTTAKMIGPFAKFMGGSQPSLFQQSSDSVYMRAANSHADERSAAYALIPTTIIYTTTDEVVKPQVGPDASSRLIGSKVIEIQSICGSTHNPQHITMTTDIGVFGVALDALTNGRPAQESAIDRSYCTKTAESLGFAAGNPVNLMSLAMRMNSPTLKKLSVTEEPPLQQYVCDRGYASGCTRNGPGGRKTTGFVSKAGGFGW